MDGVMDYTGVKTVKKGTIAVAVHGYSIGLRIIREPGVM